jgi:hypothetical protein
MFFVGAVLIILSLASLLCAFTGKKSPTYKVLALIGGGGFLFLAVFGLALVSQ